MYPRLLKDQIVQYLKDFRIVYHTGPRQAGKTTLALAVAKENGMAYHTLDDESLLTAAHTEHPPKDWPGAYPDATFEVIHQNNYLQFIQQAQPVRHRGLGFNKSSHVPCLLLILPLPPPSFALLS